MLRGQASLQELIGRSFMTRKRSGSKGKKQTPADSAQKPETERTESKLGAKQQPQQLQPGQAICPVCNVAVTEKTMNTHLGKTGHLPDCVQIVLLTAAMLGQTSPGGFSCLQMHAWQGKPYSVVRVMPNNPP